MPATAKVTRRRVRSGNSFRPVTDAHSIVDLAAALQNVMDETEFAYGNVLASDRCDLPCILDAGLKEEDQLELAEAVSAMQYFLYSWKRRGLVIREITQPAWNLPRLEKVFRRTAMKLGERLPEVTMLLVTDERPIEQRSEALAPVARLHCLVSSLVLLGITCESMRYAFERKKLN